MDINEIIREFEIEGFKRITVHPGFVVGHRRRSPRYIVFDTSERTVALYDRLKLTPLLKPDDVLIVEVEYIQENEDTGILAIRSQLDQAEDLAFLYPKLEAILKTLAKPWGTKSWSGGSR